MTEALSFIAGFIACLLFLRRVAIWTKANAHAKRPPSDKAVDALRSIERVQKIAHAHKIATRTLNEIDSELLGVE